MDSLAALRTVLSLKYLKTSIINAANTEANKLASIARQKLGHEMVWMFSIFE